MTVKFETMDFSGVASGESDMDFPTAWRLLREIGDKLDHHPRCSFTQANMLCDCGTLGNEWDRRRGRGPVWYSDDHRAWFAKRQRIGWTEFSGPFLTESQAGEWRAEIVE